MRNVDPGVVPSLRFLLALPFLGLPEPVNQSPVDLLKLVAFLHICSIFTVVPSQLKSVSLVSLAIFSLLCHNKNWWLKGSVFCYCIDKMFHVLNMILPIFMQRFPLFLNIFHLEMFPQSVICIFDSQFLEPFQRSWSKLMLLLCFQLKLTASNVISGPQTILQPLAGLLKSDMYKNLNCLALIWQGRVGLELGLGSGSGLGPKFLYNGLLIWWEWEGWSLSQRGARFKTGPGQAD